MPDFISVEVTGLKQMSERLRKLPLEIQKDGMKTALRAGADVIADEARRLVPIKRGKLYRSIRESVKTDVDVSESEATIGAGKGAAHAHLVEFGTQPHTITTKAKRILAALAPGALTAKAFQVFGVKVQHPGARRRPFMRPAYDTKKEEALKTIAKELGAFLDKSGV
jgi:HK97 gp10 family phage protein